jgi:hypothetical protein
MPPVTPVGVVVADAGEANTSIPANTPGSTTDEATRRAVKIEETDVRNGTPEVWASVRSALRPGTNVATATDCPVWPERPPTR